MVSEGSVPIDVWRALGRLAPDLRAAIVLFYFHDLKGERIAAALRISRGTLLTRRAAVTPE